MSLNPKYILPPLTKEEHRLLVIILEDSQRGMLTLTRKHDITDEDIIQDNFNKVTVLLDKISRPTIKQ